VKARLKVTEIDCVFWDGVNREPVCEALEPVLRGVIEKECESLREHFPDPQRSYHPDDAWRDLVRFTADEESGEKYDDYNMVKLWFCGGPEVSPGHWLTWSWDEEIEDWSWDYLSDVEFHKIFSLVTP
jgi:hypothetical protein